MKNRDKKYVTPAKHMLHGGDYNPEQWLDTPEILSDDIKLMRLAHTNTFSVGIFAWSMLEPKEGCYQFEWLDSIFENIYKNGGRIILATPSGSKPAWLAAKYPEILRVSSDRVKQLYGGRHNHCFTSPIYREKTQNLNRLLAERYGNHKALLMWHVSNEYGWDCHCDKCQTAFRDWLKVKYNYNIKELNDAWWGQFWSHAFSDWSEIQSPSPIGESALHGLNLDWRRFATHQTISFYENEIVPLRSITPDIPVTTNFMADTDDLIPFQALDYSKFSEYVDVVSWDAYPQWHNDWEKTENLAMKVGFINDLYRSLKQQPFILMESTPSLVNWKNVNKAKRPGMHLLSSMQFVAHGSDSVLYFQWRRSRGSSEKFHGAVVDHDNSTENRVFKDVAEVGKTLECLSPITGTPYNSEVGILYDWDSNWALNDAQGFGLDTKRYPQTLQSHYKALWEKDIPVDVITPKQDLSKYKLLVVPMLYLVSEEYIGRLKEYVTNGGNLVMTYISGIVNEHDLAYLGGWHKDLQEMFGINPVETDTLYPSDSNEVSYNGKRFILKDYATIINVLSAKVEGSYKKDFYAETPAITSHEFGNGKTYYIGGRLEDSFHNEFYGNLLAQLDIKPVVNIAHEKGVSVQVRQDTNNNYIFIMNFTEQNQEVNLEDNINMINLVTDEAVDKQFTLRPYEVKVIKQTI